eukprot:3188242-Pyramimonas_sp.AAC.1
MLGPGLEVRRQHAPIPYQQPRPLEAADERHDALEVVEVLVAEADARGEVDRADAQGKGATNVE